MSHARYATYCVDVASLAPIAGPPGIGASTLGMLWIQAETRRWQAENLAMVSTAGLGKAVRRPVIDPVPDPPVDLMIPRPGAGGALPAPRFWSRTSPQLMGVAGCCEWQRADMPFS